MKSFALDNNGDLLIENNQIQMVENENLTRQKIGCVIETNKGEWPLNVDEGINFTNLYGKNRNEDIIRNEMVQGLYQVDPKLMLDTFSYTENTEERKSNVRFTAKDNTKEITVDTTI